MGAVVGLLIAVGYIAMLVGFVWVVILGFQDSPLLGVLTFVFPIVGIWTTVKTWPESKLPFFIYLGGLGVVIVAALIGAATSGDTGTAF